jgi:hypothetical protein
VDVPENMQLRLNPPQFIAKVRTSQMNVSSRRNVEDPKRRSMCDQDIDPAGNHLPLLDQLIVRSVVGETRQIGTPRRAVDQKSTDLHGAIFEKGSMSKAELSALKEKIVVPPDTDDMLCRSLCKPDVGVIESPLVFTLEATKVSAVDENIALGNYQLPMPAMRIRDYAERCHFFAEQCTYATR